MIHGHAEVTYCRKVVFSIVALTIIILVVYSNSFHCSWHFDDMPNIVENPRLHMEKLDWESFKKALFSDRNNPRFPYRPVACLSFALNYYFGKLNVFGYHLVNLLIHLISSIFLFLLIYRTLLYLALEKRWSGDPYFVALLSAVLWAINPLQTQAVTYIVQRMASMAAMFYIVGMYAYLKGRISQKKTSKICWATLSLACFFLALGSKENAAMFPVSIALYEVVILQENPWDFVREKWPSFAVALAITLIVGIGYFFWKTGGLPDLMSTYSNQPFSLGQRLLTETRVILFYLSLLFYPMPNRLNIAHDFKISTSLFHPPTTLISILVIGALLILAVIRSKENRVLSFPILFFFANHLIESSVFPLELVFEHRNYLPSAFLFVPIAAALFHFIEYYKQKPLMKFALFSFCTLLLVGLGHSTFMRNYDWRSDYTLWSDAVKKSPQTMRSHCNLGKYYSDINKPRLALSEFMKAIHCSSSFKNYSRGVVLFNLGSVYTDLNKPQLAIREYSRISKTSPLFSKAMSNLAGIYERQGLYDKAFKTLTEAYRANPNDPLVVMNLSAFYLLQGSPEKALSCMGKFRACGQLPPKALFLLGVAFRQKGMLGKAKMYFEEALEKGYRPLECRLNLIEVYSRADLQHLAQEEANLAISILLNMEVKKREKSLAFLFSSPRLRRILPQKQIIAPFLTSAVRHRLEGFEKLISYYLG